MAFASRYPGLSTTEVLKRRGIDRLVYFHCDHFEPWRSVPGRAPDLHLGIGDVDRYLRASQERDWARTATLFYKANINFTVDPSRALWRGHPADPIGLVPPNAEAEAESRAVLDLLAGHGRELQVHIHHENITWNDRMRDEVMRAHLDQAENRVVDEERFELLVRLNLDVLARHGRLDPAAWFFVHGHWALNASDPHECTIVREIEILRRNGCLGDFTQPSGRPHTDSRLEEPYLARPVAAAKGYDRPEAEPIAAAGAGRVPADRFLIWASEINHRFCSIDHHSGFVRDRIAEPGQFARANAELGFAHGGALYVKTHAHTMQPAYWQDDGGAGPFPHAHPGIVGELGILFDTAESAGAAVEFATVSEVFAGLMNAEPAPTRDLASSYRLADGAAMAMIGCDVAFRGSDGQPVAPPPLPDPAPALPRRTAAEGELPVGRPWPEVVQLPTDPAHAPAQIRVGEDPAVAAQAEAIVRVASRVAQGRAALFPGTRPAGSDARDAARRLALIDALELPPQAPLVEIGCGNGVLSLLLAARGVPVTGIDRQADRIATARAIAGEAEAEGLLGASPRFEQAAFPDWASGRGDLDGAVAIVGSVSGESGMSGQAAFIRGLAGFQLAIVELSRFFVRRVPGAEQARLIELFVQAGFEPPRLAHFDDGLSSLAVFRHGRARGLKGWTNRLFRTLGLTDAA